MDIELRDVGAAVAVVEDVSKDALDDGKSGAGGVDRNAAGLMVVERADVIEAEDVVGMTVRVDDGVEAVDAGAQNLGAEVGRGVDDDITVARGDQDGRAKAGVAGISRVADGAGTADGGNAGTRAGTEHGDFEVHLREKNAKKSV